MVVHVLRLLVEEEAAQVLVSLLRGRLQVPSRRLRSLVGERATSLVMCVSISQ